MVSWKHSILYTAVLANYDLRLKSIFVSHGDLKPAFQADVFEYSLNLSTPVDRIGVTPEIDQVNESYKELGLPQVFIQWPNSERNLPEEAPMAVKRMIDLPDNTKDLPVFIKVVNPSNKDEQLQYRINIHQEALDKMVNLKFLTGLDNNKRGALVSPIVNEDASVYEMYVRPDAKSVKITPTCSTGCWVEIDGSKVNNGSTYKLNREKDHHRQTVEITCGKGKKTSKSYILHVMSDYPAEDILKPRITVDHAGKDCTFENDTYTCPDPKTKDKLTKVTAYINPSIRYTIESPNKDVEVRLLDGKPSVDFTYKPNLEVVAQSGRVTLRWPVKFHGAVVPSMMRFVGWLLATLLAILLFALGCVVGVANVCGVGVPFGATEIAATLTLIMQFFCFSNYLRGSTVLTHLTEPIRWVSLYWPLPWHMKDPNAPHHRHLFEGASSHGVELWGNSLLGDVTDVRNACGALFWTSLIFLGLMIVHGSVLLTFHLYSSKHTFPHRLRFGNWESRILHWLSFPSCTAAANVIVHANTTLFWKVYGIVVLVVYAAWVSTAFFKMGRAVHKNRVTWVWNSSTREDGELEDESGYWSDVICDQLQTHPVNRSLFKWFFQWIWVSTVADIDPINIHPNIHKKKEGEFAPMEYGHAHSEGSMPMAKNPKTVEVIRSRKGFSIFPGQRLVTGLLRTEWLDVLFTYEGLVQFHTQASVGSNKQLTIPLTVKTQQLTGRVTTGSQAFFYDGARVPFVRIFDSVYRILLGLFIGSSLASTRHSVDALMFTCVSFLSVGALVYMGVKTPYSRRLENWLGMSVFTTISLAAIAFMSYAIAKKEPSIAADMMLWLVAICCVIVSVYSLVVTFSVFSALICPPLEESRFLEKIANCNVTISNHSEGWAVDIPAFAKYKVVDLKAHVTPPYVQSKNKVSLIQTGEEPTFEFTAKEVIEACKTGRLKIPFMCCFAPGRDTILQYRYINIYNRSEIGTDLYKFLASDHSTSSNAKEVASDLANKMQHISKGRTIVSVTIVPFDDRNDAVYDRAVEMIKSGRHQTKQDTSSSSG